MNALAARRWRLRHFPPPPRGPWAVPADPECFDAFLLMGQSNMAGFGCVRADDPWRSGDFEPVPGVLVLDGQCKATDGRPRSPVRWRPAAHPLHLNQRSAGFGLGLPFAGTLRAEGPARTVGLIPCAWGGAPISLLEPGTPLFGNAVTRARVAAEKARLRAVLWHQGESDAESPDLAERHADRLVALMRELRRELDIPDLCFLIGDLAGFGSRRGPRAPHDLVRAGLRAVAAEDPHAAFVESEGLAKIDSVHFGRAALIEFGQRYAKAFLEYGDPCRTEGGRDGAGR